MEIEIDEAVLKEEKRLVSTMITGKPQKLSFVVAVGTVLIMAFASQLYWSDPKWSQLLPAVKNQIFADGEWWRLITAIFIHADFGHFLSNMYMLSIFSFFVFGYFGFGVFPTLSIFWAAVVNLLAISTYGPEVRLLGASGLVYLLGGFWLTLYFVIQRQYNIANRLLRVTGIAFMIFLPTSFVPTTSYRSHALGFAAGVIMGLIYFVRNRKKIRSFERYKTIYV